MIVFFKGFLIGLANIIPGVSGGTLALILGIYKRMISALHSIGMPLVKALIAVILFKKGAFAELGKELRRIDAGFMALIGVGAVVAILATSSLMENMLENYHSQSYAFFFGLVMVSIIFPYRYLKRRSWREVIAFVLALVMTVSLTFLVSEEEQVEKVKVKQVLHVADDAAKAEVALQGGDVSASDESGFISFEHPGGKRLVMLFFAAALAISAMVLPGISGSFVLLLLGAYFDVLHAVNDRQVIVLAVFCLGLGVGLLVFSRIMNFLLEKLYNITMAFMIGLMVGSLYVLWPFKKIVIVVTESVYTEKIYRETVYPCNIIPESFGSVEIMSLVAVVAGAVIIAGFYFYSRKRGFEE